MPRSPVELARELYLPGIDLAAIFADQNLLEAFRARLREQFHPDVVAGDPQNRLIPMAEGVAGFIEAWTEWLSAWESWRIESVDFRDGEDDSVVVFLDIRARSKTESVEMPMQGANVLWFEKGLVTRLELHTNRDDALRAAGISPG